MNEKRDCRQIKDLSSLFLFSHSTNSVCAGSQLFRAQDDPSIPCTTTPIIAIAIAIAIAITTTIMSESGSGGGTKSRKGGATKRKPFHPNYDYEVDYNDHFETPLQAYKDILPLLDSIAPSVDFRDTETFKTVEEKRKQNIIYDPYYCNGRTKGLLQSLGFERVVHEKRDFYKDIAEGNVPKHHTLVTNPPYSDDHKEKCLQFCVDGFRSEGKSFFLLIPNYVAARSYYRRILGETIKDVAYLLPTREYSYSHPEGTGHEESPFASLWFCCVGRDTIQTMAKKGRKKGGPKFIASFDELVDLGVVSLENRPNPRQRKKMRKLAEAGTAGVTNKAQSSNKKKKNTIQSITPKERQPTKKKRTNSKYRNKTGERIKKRF